MEFFLRVDYADISLLGGREENQDRVAVAASEHSALLVVVDGMGHDLPFGAWGRILDLIAAHSAPAPVANPTYEEQA